MIGYDDLSERTRAINDFVTNVYAIGSLMEDLDDSPRVAHFTSAEAAQIGRMLRKEAEVAGELVTEIICEEHKALEARATA